MGLLRPCLSDVVRAVAFRLPDARILLSACLASVIRLLMLLPLGHARLLVLLRVVVAMELGDASLLLGMAAATTLLLGVTATAGLLLCVSATTAIVRLGSCVTAAIAAAVTTTTVGAGSCRCGNRQGGHTCGQKNPGHDQKLPSFRVPTICGAGRSCPQGRFVGAMPHFGAPA